MTGEQDCLRWLRAGETLDDLRVGGLRIIQKKDGYRFSLDPVLLCAFARIAPGETVCDLGTGSGIIPLLLARRTPAGSITGIEVQPELADRARRSVALNGLEERVTIMICDLRRIRGSLAAESCQVVLANPPFRASGSGRLSPSTERALARHEVHGDLSDFVRSAAWLLPTGGRFFLVYLAERLAEMLLAMRAVGLEPKRLRCVHSRQGEEARLVLVEGRKGGRAGLRVEAPLYVYGNGSYTTEVLDIYGEGD